MAKLLLIAFEPHETVMGAGFAQSLAMPFDVLCITGSCDQDLGAEKVLTGGLSEVPPADGLAKSIQGVANGYSHVAAVSSMRSKDVLARLAGLLDAAMVTDVTAIDSPTVFKRPIVAGSIIAT